LRCYLVLDTSASMAFGEPAKVDYARRLMANLAYLLVQQGDAVGVRCFGEAVMAEVPPRRNPAHLQPIFRTLEDAAPRGETRLVAALHDLAERITARALVIVFSDFFCPLEELLNALQHLRFQKHDLALFHLLDRREVEFDFDRPMRFLDMELPGSLLAEPAVIKRHYLAHLEAYLERFVEGCHQFDADYRRVLVDQDFETVLANFLVDRTRLKGHRG